MSIGSVTARVVRSVGDDAAAQLGRIARELGEHAVPVLRPLDMWGSRLAAPNLVAITATDAARGADALAALVRWVDDGNCFSRAVLGAAHMDQLLAGGRAIGGVDDAVRAAVAWVPTSQRQTPWVFHAATVFRSADDGALRVIDRLQSPAADGVMLLDDWARSVHRTVDDVVIQHAVDNIPLGGGLLSRPTMPADYRSMARTLAASIRRGAAAPTG